MRRKTIRCEFVFESWVFRCEHQTLRTTIPTVRNRTFVISARPCSQRRVASEVVWWLRVTFDGMLPTPKKFQIVICGDRHTPEVLTSSILRMFLAIFRIFSRAVGARIVPWHAENNLVRAYCRGKSTRNDIAPKGAGSKVILTLWRRLHV